MKSEDETKRRAHLTTDVAAYYTSKLAEHGASPRGVDWNGPASQQLRFEQLCRVIDSSAFGSIADFGCGYGALFEFLDERFPQFEYTGIDASKEMIDNAQARLVEKSYANFFTGTVLNHRYDYVIASGVFNVRVGRSDQEWLEYIEDTIEMLAACSKRGLAFNCLTSYSDRNKMRDDLYYANPSYLFDLCKRLHSPNVALLHDYGLYEFTILIRKAA